MGFRIRRIFRPIERVGRAIGGIFKRRSGDGGGGGYYEGVLEQVQKIEIVLKDPTPDDDKIRLKELTNAIILYDLKEDIPENFSLSYLIEHFDMTEIEGRWE